jgi:hypothetical protein
MEPKTKVASVPEWLQLPEIFAPRIRSESEEVGAVAVLKVGMLAVSVADCANAQVVAPVVVGDKCILPTAVIELSGNPVLHRLPIGLTEWVIDCIALAKVGKNQFPAQVEFGELRGCPYAEFRVKRSDSH